MVFCADENIESGIVKFLRNKGYEVFYVSETYPSILDAEILEYANKNNMIILTNDKDFGELLFLQKRVSAGILLICTSQN